MKFVTLSVGGRFFQLPAPKWLSRSGEPFRSTNHGNSTDSKMPWPLSMVGGDSLFRNSVRWRRGCPPDQQLSFCFTFDIFYRPRQTHTQTHTRISLEVEGMRVPNQSMHRRCESR